MFERNRKRERRRRGSRLRMTPHSLEHRPPLMPPDLLWLQSLLRQKNLKLTSTSRYSSRELRFLVRSLFVFCSGFCLPRQTCLGSYVKSNQMTVFMLSYSCGFCGPSRPCEFSRASFWSARHVFQLRTG